MQQENNGYQDERDRLISLQEQKENRYQQSIQAQEELSRELVSLKQNYQDNMHALQDEQVERNKSNSKLVSLRKELNI